MSKKISLFIVALTFCGSAHAASRQSTPPRHSYESPRTTMHHSDYRSPWDFTLGFGLYNPGTGIGVLGAYRVVDGLIPASTQNDLVLESGLTYISIGQTLSSGVISNTWNYTLFEIPFQARWDFYLLDNKLIVGPRLGINYESSASFATTFGTTATAGGGLSFQIGGDAIYYFTPNFGARINLGVGGYTTLLIGLNYTP